MISRVARQLGIGDESLRAWVKRAEVDAGKRPGLTSEEQAEPKRLRKENFELRRSNDILQAAATFSGGARPPSKEVVAFIDAHRDHMTDGRRWGVEPICETLQVAPSTYYDAKSRPPSARAVRDAELGPALEVLWKRNYSAYGRRKLTKAARRAGHDVGRDQVARLMRCQGIRGASRAKKRFTTKSDPNTSGPRTSSTATFTPAGPTSCGCATSPTARRGAASSTWPSSSTCTHGASSAGRQRDP